MIVLDGKINTDKIGMYDVNIVAGSFLDDATIIKNKLRNFDLTLFKTMFILNLYTFKGVNLKEKSLITDDEENLLCILWLVREY